VNKKSRPLKVAKKSKSKYGRTENKNRKVGKQARKEARKPGK